MQDPNTGEKYWKCGRTEEINDPSKRFSQKEIKKFAMKLEAFVVDDLIKTTTFENNFKQLIKIKNIHQPFPHDDFHGKDETFQVNDGKALFNEAIEMKFEGTSKIIERPNVIRKGISQGYCNNDNKRNGRIYKIKNKKKKLKRIKKKI